MFNKVINLQLFANYNVNTTTQTTTGYSMSPTMKTFYDTALLENARPELVFNQFGDKQKLHGNKVEWRKFNTFPKALTPLTEGVIPDGKSFGMSYIEATTTQHGDYTTVSDRLEFESYDDVIYGATEEMGAAGGATFNTLTRNILYLQAGVHVYAPKGNGTAVNAEPDSEVVGVTKMDNTCLITPKTINQVVTRLKKNHTPKIDGYYIAIIHPSVAEDLRESAEWKEFHKYNDVAPIYKGEIGTLHGVRFIENTEALVRKETGMAFATYETFIFGAKSYGILDPEGEAMEMIIKDKGVIGGPLEQFSTIGYKFCHGAKVLYPERFCVLHTASSYSGIDEAN